MEVLGKKAQIQGKLQTVVRIKQTTRIQAQLTGTGELTVENQAAVIPKPIRARVTQLPPMEAELAVSFHFRFKRQRILQCGDTAPYPEMLRPMGKVKPTRMPSGALLTGQFIQGAVITGMGDTGQTVPIPDSIRLLAGGIHRSVGMLSQTPNRCGAPQKLTLIGRSMGFKPIR